MAIRNWAIGKGTGTGNWSDREHWSDSSVPANGDIAILGDLPGPNYVVSLDVDSANLMFLQFLSPKATLAVGKEGGPARTLTVSGTDGSAINLGGGGHISIAAGSTVSTNGGLFLGNTGVIGAGRLHVGDHIFGAGSISADGGVLDVFGTIDAGVSLFVGSRSPTELRIEGAATSLTAINLSSSNQTLGIAGSLTISDSQAVRGGKIAMYAGSTLNSSKDIVIAGGSLVGAGTVTAKIRYEDNGRGGHVQASGGTLELKGDVLGGDLQVADVAGSVLKISGTGENFANEIRLDTRNKHLVVASNLTMRGDLGIANGGSVQVDGTLNVSKINLSDGKITGAGSLSSSVHVVGHGEFGMAVNVGLLQANEGVLTATGNFFASTLAASWTKGVEAVLRIEGHVTTTTMIVDLHTSIEIANHASVRVWPPASGGQRNDRHQGRRTVGLQRHELGQRRPERIW